MTVTNNSTQRRAGFGRSRRVAAVAALAAATLTLAACSTKAPDSSGGSSGGGGGAGAIKTDVGVTADTISLGAFTDQSGVFKNLGLGIVHGNQLWADSVNNAGGICGRKVAIEVADHGYKADTATTLYPGLSEKVLGFVQMLGSPVVAALGQNLQEDKLTAIPASWSSELLSNPYIAIVGTTYDLEMIDGMSYLQQQGKLKDGDKVGHIYIDGEYGKNGLRGAQYYAQQHNISIVEGKIASTDTDMTNIVTGFKDQGVNAILLTVAPSTTASTLAANAALGLNVPVMGNNPTWDPALLQSPAKDALGNLYVSASSVPYSSDVPKAQEVAKAYEAKFTEPPNAGIDVGYAEGMVWQAFLEKACTNGDMTREGLHTAVGQTTSASTEDLVAPLDFSNPGSPATRQVYIAQPDASAPGGLKQVQPLFEAPEAASYVAPHQK
ncbi:ABC transporter substrate-binding protein [Rhodococcus aerolatus]